MKKLSIKNKVLFSIVTIILLLASLLIINATAAEQNVPAEMLSKGKYLELTPFAQKYVTPNDPGTPVFNVGDIITGYDVRTRVVTINGETYTGHELTVADLRNEYPLLCCQHGTPLPTGVQIPIDIGWDQDELSALMQNMHLVEVTNNSWDYYGEYDGYVAKTPAWYHIVEERAATPEEAYILAEMVMEKLPEGVVLIPELDANGNPILVDEDEIEGELYMAGGDGYYLYEAEYAVDTPDGHTYKADLGGYDNNGKPYYVYKYDENHQKEETTTSLVEPDLKLYEGRGYYEQNWQEIDVDGNVDGAIQEGNVYLTSNKIAMRDESGRLIRARVQGGNSYIQYAWWASRVINEGTIEAPNSLSKEAKAFEEYILRISKCSSVEEVMSKYVDHPYELTINGQTYSGMVPAYPIEYDAKYMSTEQKAAALGVPEEQAEITVAWDEEKQVYKIGPFGIDYVEARTHISGRPEVEFSGITGMKLYTNLGEVPEDKWRILFLADQRSNDDDYKFPHESEIFYIEMDYIEGAKEILDLATSFRFMNAGGAIQKIDCNYNEAVFTSHCKANTDTDEDGNEYVVDYTNWLTAVVTTHDAQTLATAIIGARWYEEAEIHLALGPLPDFVKGRLAITKEVENASENDDTRFTFNVYYNNEFVEQVLVKPGETVFTSEFTWLKTDPVPTYRVEEVDIPEGYEFVGIENGSGTLKENETVMVIAKNKQTEHTGHIRIIKRVTDVSDRDEVYKFDVKVDNRTIDTAVITVPAGGSSSEYVSPEIKWTGDTAPTYNVEEIEIPDFVNDVTYENKSGTVGDGAETTVTATNNTDKKEYHLRILKKVTDISDRDETYTFDVYINNAKYTTVTITVPAGGRSSEATITYRQSGNTAPTYNVEEVSVPDFVEDVTYENKSGTMSTGTTPVTVTATNHIVYPREAKIRIIKTVSEPADIDEVYKFNVHVDGYEDEVVTITVPRGATTGSAETEQTYRWKSTEAGPKYLVTEIEVPEGYTVTMTNEKGRLTQNDEKVVTVSALNSKIHPHLGSITIKKTVDGPVNDTDKFTIKVKVTYSNGSTHLYEKELKANESWKLLEYWLEGETAPTYEVEEVNIPEGYVLKDITNKSGSFEVDKNIDVLCQNQVEYRGHLVLTKVVTGGKANTDPFKFKVTINGETKDVELVAGAKWTSDEYTWKYGEEAPAYNVEEVNIPDGYILVGIDNQSGVLSSSGTVNVRAVNKSDSHEGRLILKKVIENAADENTVFHFNVKIGDNVQTVDLKAGRSWTSDIIKWNGNTAPSYEVTEVNVPAGYSQVRIDNGTGTLSATQTVTATAVNRADEHNGQVAVTKKIVTDEKLKADAVEGRFTVKITITGTFEADGESVVNGSRTYTKEIAADETFTSPNIKWYGNNAPLYSISETNLPKGWVLESITNKSGKLSDGHTVNATITNSLTTEVVIDLTMELGGVVWEDSTNDEKLVERVNDTGKGHIADGRYDKDNELGISGVEVYVEKVLYGQGGNEIARVAPIAYEESGSPLSFPVYTSASDLGKWSVPRIELGVTEAEKAMGASYARFNIRFVYDGQTYEPTVPLVNGDAAAYRAASTAAKEGWFDNSMADDINRQEVNNRVAEVYGGNAANDTSTDGYVRGLDGTEATIKYNTASGDDGKMATSTVVTRDNNNVALPLFKAKATTDKVGLVYPFNNRSHLRDIDKKLTERGIVETYHYIATYPYTLNINLGLVKRETSDLSIAKDLDKAIVVANGKMLTYKYNSILNKLSEGPLVAIESRDTVNGYKLNVYSTDYYYRSSIYDHLLNENGAGLKAALDNFYSEMGFQNESKDSELEIYLNYKVLVFNNSQGDYIATVNKLADYYDDSLELVREDKMAYVNTQDAANDQIKEGLIKVADKPTYTTSEGQTNVVNWIDSQEGIPSPAIVSANRSGNVKSMTTTSLKDIRLARGQYILLDMTFKVNKQTNDQGVEDSIILGEKNNIAEIASYSIYDREGNVEGKIDRNSAPANINSDEYYYEDDTDKAPVVDIELYETKRSIDGMVWEDAQTKEVEFNEIVGDGKYKASDDQVIAGLDTSLVEKVIVKNGDNYREFEAIWDTSDTTIEGLGGNSIESLTGFDSTVETDSEGKYYFNGVPAGNFAVRYTYGNKDIPTTPLDTRIGVFNGQDYKTTAYQVGFAAVQEDGTLVNEWHDLTNEALANEPVNDARDVEPERLNVIAKSKVMTNYNGEILASANDRDADHTELYNQYQMMAETAKLDLEVEDIITNEAVKALLTGEADVSRIGGIEIYGKALKDNPTEFDNAILNDTLEYKFINIDCGLEARSDNEVVLDKQIKNIKLTTADNQVIADVNFDIAYNYKGVNPDGTSKWSTTVTVNKATSKGYENLQAVNKDVVRGIQNFRYLNVDENILQGAVISIEYQITALNNGEVDRVGTALAELNTPEEIIAASNELRNSIENFSKEGDRYTRNDVVGHYLGSVYYNGTEAKGNDDVVKTKVRQLVDYIDNDAVYTQAYNSNRDHSWKVTTERELLDVGASDVVSNSETYETRLLSKSLLVNDEGLVDLVDKNGKLFTTTQKNNIVLSIDSDANSNELSNAGFIRELVPANADSDNVDNYTAAIFVSTSRTIASQTEANDMAFDNLAEIVKFENEVGRRDIESVVGNANPSFNIAEEFISDDVEHDQSATELITLTPPTGINTNSFITLQVIGISLVALAVVAGGIVIIKKKVIEK